MIIVGNKNLRFINKDAVLCLKLVKGKTTAFITGDVMDDENIKVDTINVKEPWTIHIITSFGNEYQNCKTFDEALDLLIEYLGIMGLHVDFEKYKESLRKHYGQ